MYDKSKLEEIESEFQRWRKECLDKSIETLPERDRPFFTTSSVPIDRLYTPLDLKDFDYAEKLGMPGEYPFTRGVHPTLYRSKLWTMRMFSGFGTAEETNKRYKYLLHHGETGLSVAFDFPTLYGHDTDNPKSEGEFGKCGVAISSLKDMEILFDGIPVDKISTSMTINGPAPIVWAFYIGMAENKGISPTQISGTIQNDILKEYIAQKSYIFPPEPSMRLIVDAFEYGYK
ncbi:MAG: methylmalonyl-CoA mutase family protein, partial [Thermoplasmata archaeon]